MSRAFGKCGAGGVLKGPPTLRLSASTARIATVAGVDFGSDAHIRLSYATGLDTIKEGMRRLAAAVGSLLS
jgi:aspartate aminotransferase